MSDVFALAKGLVTRINARVLASSFRNQHLDNAVSPDPANSNEEWRRSLMIPEARQLELKGLLASSDPSDSPFPFQGVKLFRADIEWLLETHESCGERGPVLWPDDAKVPPRRHGLDLRGAILSGEDLSGLPLARTLFGSSISGKSLEKEGKAAADLKNVKLVNTDLRGAIFTKATLTGAHLVSARLDHARLVRTRLRYAVLDGAQLQNANLFECDLQGAELTRCRLEGTSLVKTNLSRCDIRWSHFDRLSDLADATLSNGFDNAPRLADVHWNDVLMTTVHWETISRIGDEIYAEDATARRLKVRHHHDQSDPDYDPLKLWILAARAYGQLSTALRNQGLIEDADRFAYRARVLSRRHLLRKWGTLRAWLFSGLIWIVAGYGYRPFRALGWYSFTITLFAVIFFQIDRNASGGNFQWDVVRAFTQSVAAFHGRGLFTYDVSDDLNRDLAVIIEAFIGLIIEAILVATFIQRFFSR